MSGGTPRAMPAARALLQVGGTHPPAMPRTSWCKVERMAHGAAQTLAAMAAEWDAEAIDRCIIQAHYAQVGYAHGEELE